MTSGRRARRARLPESRVRKQPGPLEFRAPLSHCQKDTAPWENCGTEVTSKQTCGEPPGLAHLRTWASHPIMSRRTNRAAALIPRCRPEPDD